MGTAVTYLNLAGNSIGDAGAAAIAEALKTNTVVTTLFLGVNRIGDAGAAAIAEALKTNTAVTTLYLSGNSIGAEIDRFVQTILSVRASGSVVPACSNLGAVDEATGRCNCLHPAVGTGPTCSDNTILPEGIRRAQLQTEIADLKQSSL